MPRFTQWPIAIFWTCIIVAAMPLNALAAASTDTPAAIVNGTPIPQSVVQRQLDSMVDSLARRGQMVNKDVYNSMRKKVLENLIDRELMYQHCKSLGLGIDAAELEKQLAAGKSRYPSEAVYQESLAAAGLTEADVRGRLERQLTIRSFIRKQLVPKIAISDSDVRQYYEAHPKDFSHPDMVRVSHILIRIDATKGKAGVITSRKAIEAIQGQIKAGGDFAKLAETHSEDETTKAKGGSLGFIGYGQTVPPFEIAAFALEAGQVSDIIKTNYGFHLIKLHERMVAGQDDYEKVSSNIRRYLTQIKIDNEMGAIADKLRTKAKIVRPTAKKS